MNWQDAGWYGRLCREITNETGSRAICHVWTRQNSRHKTKDGTEPWPKGEVNFRLILQAPQMLEALEKISSLVKLSMSWGDLNEIERLADSVIAAVKGEQADEKA